MDDREDWADEGEEVDGRDGDEAGWGYWEDSICMSHNIWDERSSCCLWRLYNSDLTSSLKSAKLASTLDISNFKSAIP